MSIKILNKFIKSNVKVNEKISFQDWINIKNINKNIITLNNNTKVVLLKVLPINFNLKSKLEQKAILNSYKLFLKNLNSKIQIIISSRKTDVSAHIDEIIKNTNENPLIKEMSKDYIELINQIIEQKGTITKEFYIVMPYSSNIENEIVIISENLSLCGNYIEECSKDEVTFLLKNFLNKRLINNCNCS